LSAVIIEQYFLALAVNLSHSIGIIVRSNLLN
jgi:hypothetical protein